MYYNLDISIQSKDIKKQLQKYDDELNRLNLRLRILSQLRKNYVARCLEELKEAQDQLREVTQQRLQEECCAVCIQPIYNESTIKMLQCGHQFHDDCVKPVNKCPQCRCDVEYLSETNSIFDFEESN